MSSRFSRLIFKISQRSKDGRLQRPPVISSHQNACEVLTCSVICVVWKCFFFKHVKGKIHPQNHTCCWIHQQTWRRVCIHLASCFILFLSNTDSAFCSVLVSTSSSRCKKKLNCFRQLVANFANLPLGAGQLTSQNS